MKKIALAGLIVVALAAAVAYSLYSRILGFAEQPLNPDSAELLTVKPGTGRVALATLLEEQKLVADAQWLPWLLRVDPSLAHYKAGTYRLTPGMTVRQLMQLLVSGREAQFSIRFIEGTRFSEWLPILQQAPYLEHDLQGLTNKEIAQKLGIKQGSVEGWLFPDTYHYVAGTSALDILRRAHRRMEKELTIAWDGREKGLPLQSPYEMLTLASIIEKETAIESERTRVSSVFVNRLRLGMRLQTDPTVIYGMGEQYNGNITRKDLQTPTAYNTYTINGLPPTPIAMPGLASLNAAAHPDTTQYLYFVADGSGGHQFSTNLNAHNQAVRNYVKQLREKKQ